MFSDYQTQLGVISPPPTSLDVTSYGGRLDEGGPDYAARLSQLFGSFGIFNFQYARHSDRYATIPINNDLPAILDFTNSETGVDS